MKTITKTEVVPAEEVTIITFGCDFCEFVADDEDDVKKHHAKEHACKRTMGVEGVDLYWFDSEEDAKAWLECDEYGADMHSVNWSGAGRYHTSWSTEPCGRGCCSRSRRTLSPVGWYCVPCCTECNMAKGTLSYGEFILATRKRHLHLTANGLYETVCGS